jgi:hypothetical protein
MVPAQSLQVPRQGYLSAARDRLASNRMSLVEQTLSPVRISRQRALRRSQQTFDTLKVLGCLLVQAGILTFKVEKISRVFRGWLGLGSGIALSKKAGPPTAPCAL